MKVKNIDLDCGSKLLYCKRDGYFSYIKFHFNVGSDDEDDNIRGVAHLLEHMMFNGSNKYTKLELSEKIEECGGNINACTSEFYTKYYGNVLSEYTGKLFDILSSMCFEPLLDEDDFENEKNIVIQELHDRNDDIWSYTYDSYFYKFFGIFPTVGIEDVINKITYDDFIDFYKKYYNFNNLIISIVTPLDVDNVKDIVNNILNKYSNIVGCVNSKQYKLNILNTDYNETQYGLEQVKMLTGFLIPPNLNDYSDIYTQILGGGSSSRLFKNIREDKKLCYQVFSYAYNLEVENYIGIGISYNDIDKSNEILQYIRNEISNMSNISFEEFERAKFACISNICHVDEDKDMLCDDIIIRYKNGISLSTEDRIKEIENITLEDFNDFISNYCIDKQLYTYKIYSTK